MYPFFLHERSQTNFWVRPKHGFLKVWTSKQTPGKPSSGTRERPKDSVDPSTSESGGGASMHPYKVLEGNEHAKVGNGLDG